MEQSLVSRFLSLKKDKWSSRTFSQSEYKGYISPTYEFVVDILQEGQPGLKEVHRCWGDVFAT